MWKAAGFHSQIFTKVMKCSEQGYALESSIFKEPHNVTAFANTCHGPPGAWEAIAPLQPSQLAN